MGQAKKCIVVASWPWPWQGKSPREWEAGIPGHQLVSVRQYALERDPVVSPDDNILAYYRDKAPNENDAVRNPPTDVTLPFCLLARTDKPGRHILVICVPHMSVSRATHSSEPPAAIDLALSFLEGLNDGTFFKGPRNPPKWHNRHLQKHHVGCCRWELQRSHYRETRLH